MSVISKVHARQILDSRGNPTLEAEVWLEDGSFGRAAVPSGASTGAREALELRDGGSAYLGKSVMKAVGHVKDVLTPKILHQDWEQESLDDHLVSLDGTDFKTNLGANALLGVSMAFAVAQAQSSKVPLWQYITGLYGSRPKLPRPMFNIMNGGAHANWTTDIQEYMILPVDDAPYSEHLRKAVEIYHHLGKGIDKRGLSVNVGNEGGYAPALRSNEDAFELILEAIQKAGYSVGKDGDFMLGLDIAASEFLKEGKYVLKRDNSVKTPDEMYDWVLGLTKKYPLLSLEDVFADTDWENWSRLTAEIGTTHQIVGDDLLVTNPVFVKKAIELKSCNALLVKVNQIGTVTEALRAMKTASQAGWNNVPSHRSGETEDVFIAHLAVGTGAGQIKTGAPSRTDRTAKYNELLRIEEQL